MANTRPDIRKIFESKIIAFTAPSISLALENVKFEPVGGVPYCALFLLFGDPSNPEMGSKLAIEVGIFQINLRYPSGDGAGDIDAHAQALKDYFKPVQNISGGSTTVVLHRTAIIGNGMQDGDRYQIAVKVPFYSIVT